MKAARLPADEPKYSAPPIPSPISAPVHPVDAYFTKRQLAEKLNIKTRGVDGLVTRRVIPTVRLSQKTTRVFWPDFKAAIDRLIVKEVS